MNCLAVEWSVQESANKEGEERMHRASCVRNTHSQSKNSNLTLYFNSIFVSIPHSFHLRRRSFACFCCCGYSAEISWQQWALVERARFADNQAYSKCAPYQCLFEVLPAIRSFFFLFSLLIWLLGLCVFFSFLFFLFLVRSLHWWSHIHVYIRYLKFTSKANNPYADIFFFVCPLQYKLLWHCAFYFPFVPVQILLLFFFPFISLFLLCILHNIIYTKLWLQCKWTQCMATTE